jgi:hypothetical protein
MHKYRICVKTFLLTLLTCLLFTPNKSVTSHNVVSDVRAVCEIAIRAVQNVLKIISIISSKSKVPWLF